MSDSSPENRGSSSGDDGPPSPSSSTTPFDELLSSFDHLFKDRYTDMDKDFMATVDREPLPPPCIHPWYSKPRRNFDYSRHRRGRGDNRYHPYNRPRDAPHHSQRQDQQWHPYRQGGQRHSGGQRPRW